MFCYLSIGFIVTALIMIITKESVIEIIKENLSDTDTDWWNKIGGLIFYISACMGMVWGWPFMISWFIKELVQEIETKY